MPSGKSHDRITTLTSIAIFPAAFIVTSGSQSISFDGLINGAIASLSCLISGIWLSPDADCSGYLKHRYGLFRFIWSPYYTAAHWGGHYRVHGKPTHRSHLSHSPLIGSMSKVLYLGAIATLVLPLAGMDIATIYPLAQNHSSELMWAAIAMEVGAAVHYIADWVWSELH